MFSLIFHPLLLLRVLGMFILWYVWEMPAGIVRMYAAYALALGEIFSFRFLLRTLFSIWKGISEEYSTKKGIHIDQIFGTFCLNTFSRVIGGIFRILAILLGISVQLLCLTLFIIAIVAWIAYPIGVYFGMRFLFQTFLP
ncbi:hypothetical protein A3H22_03720 [Candidatus Peribacteria bacterium RIFCSPLOWO2_12_FULL_55_15]|nr:MAG: hypothetical protein A2789_03590 [Candidatus Peribacteria bacterium RIFCSPHIGHO2_01_FULL_54_22]OGJ62675.1 MAG: hypothetical protein A3D12_04240 [Candidatus Peribacteria bacterium RIFCSPHIGHO2_02_FULL_55_24]OGJ64786.1 MAG: hypothetical protein A3E47_00495 [Candidatus Peribacteria bacterium RIFCSPHIGHO2_12_FULL_54_10]OGJ68318.1 MAG: hypothetical protein A2947_04110 [Candidatus Peribacteria bacterium RIFCSPLOWO2_01_FULL_54_110]OGJ69025.1 MAG: hypothetical protein A3H90_03925 [Candidatus Pe